MLSFCSLVLNVGVWLNLECLLSANDWHKTISGRAWIGACLFAKLTNVTVGRSIAGWGKGLIRKGVQIA